MSVRLTVAVQSDKAPGEYAALAALAERFGFDGLSVYADLSFQPPLPALLEAAAATRGIELGPACLNPYLTHPVEIAGQTAYLDAASAGRGYLGLARGSWLDRVGLAQDRPLTALRETVAVVDRLLAGDDSGFEGRVFRLDPGFRLQTAPRRRRVPMLLGVWGARGAALAAEIADRVKIGGSANPDMVAWMRSRLDQASAALTDRGVGARSPRVELGVGAVTVVAEDGAAARAEARRQVAMYLDVVAALDPTVQIAPDLLARLSQALRSGDIETAAGLVEDTLLDRFALAGTPGQVAEHARQLIEAGADAVEFGTPHGLRPHEGLALLGERVLPLLREL